MIPEFAVIGHPNEGKSSVVSTLTENDQIRISPFPGETTVARAYAVTIDGREIIRFVDTPGFQVPQQTLSWFQSDSGDLETLIDRFIETHKDDPFYADECELLSPVARGAGIIYVVDGSRPVREDDIAEMEILRLTGRPRMAVVNSKNYLKDYTREWKQEFGKHFNATRIFNSNTANFHERIKMLESLKAIDQDWESMLDEVIRAFKSEWRKRNQLCSIYIKEAIEKASSYSVWERIDQKRDMELIRQRLNEKYQRHLKSLESDLFHKIKLLYKHHVYKFDLPEYSVLQHDLFSKQTWDFLGLTSEQLLTAGAVLGGGMGAAIDTAAAGITFGVFTAIGSLVGAGSALLGGKRMAQKGKLGVRLGGDRLQIGPNDNIQLMYILLDRSFIYYSQIINRPHGRRDCSIINPTEKADSPRQGICADFSEEQRKTSARFFKAVRRSSLLTDKKAATSFILMIEGVLETLSGE